MEQIKILYQDDTLAVIDKPAGMVVNRAQTVTEETVQDWVERSLDIDRDDKDEVFLKRSGVAHRLDKETSGCLVVAKKAEVLAKLLKQFKERQVKKEYLALVHGRLSPKEGTVNLPIGRDIKDRKKRRVRIGGKKALTEWQVEGYYRDKAGREFSLVRLLPQTGRTHQIRVHLAHLGHTLWGDRLYGRKKQVRDDREKLGRQFLQAAAIELVHPETGRQLRVETRLAPELKALMGELSKSE